MTPEHLAREALDLAGKATPGDRWYKRFHRGGDCYGPLDTLRGPFFSWILFRKKEQAPINYFSDAEQDAEFIAASRTLVPELAQSLLDTLAQLKAAEERALLLMACLEEIRNPETGLTHRDMCILANSALANRYPTPLPDPGLKEGGK